VTRAGSRDRSCCTTTAISHALQGADGVLAGGRLQLGLHGGALQESKHGNGLDMDLEQDNGQIDIIVTEARRSGNVEPSNPQTKLQPPQLPFGEYGGNVLLKVIGNCTSIHKELERYNIAIHKKSGEEV
jgi:hypothetical protein